MYCVIMAGGRGTRFWPSSRHSEPKQFLNIVGGKSMLQITVDRLRKLRFSKEIFIVTGADLAPLIKERIEGIEPENIIVEPSGKNTAPCIGLAALHIRDLNDEAVMGLFPADHLIVGHRAFERSLRTAVHLARKNGSLVTIGIPPTYPSTGYGYIQYDPHSPEDHLNAYRVRTFAEKPHLKLARRFLKSEDFLWNGGMFVWTVKSFFKQLKEHMPELCEHLEEISRRRGDYGSVWEDIIPESIDYGLMEKADNIYVVKAEFNWNDLGSWNAVYDISPKSKGENVLKGDGVVIEGKGNFVHSNGHFTALLGVDNLAVINTPDATLVVPRDRVEEVKSLVEYLRKKKRDDLL